MGRSGTIAIVIVLAALALAVFLSSRDALEGPANTPSERSEVPAPGGGTNAIPAERQQPN